MRDIEIGRGAEISDLQEEGEDYHFITLTENGYIIKCKLKKSLLGQDKPQNGKIESGYFKGRVEFEPKNNNFSTIEGLLEVEAWLDVRFAEEKG